MKADIRHYFDTVDHETLLKIVEHRIKDQNVIGLIKRILENHETPVKGVGMPIGNLTSQFFANVYLHQLDLFVKHQLKAKYYIRYVDDFVILHRDKRMLQTWEGRINEFLKESLKIELHPDKTKIIRLDRGVTLLGFRIFEGYRLLKKSNTRRIWKRLDRFKEDYDEGTMSADEAGIRLSGWITYARFGNTYKLRSKVTETFRELV